MEEILQSFNYHSVKLNESHFRRQRDEVIETYLAIENDDLLHYFRKVAGIADHAKGLVGWYGNNASTFGQFLGAYAKLYLTTGDIRLYDKAIFLADEWGKCADASQSVIDVNGTYTYDKLMGGFLDLLEYLNYKPAGKYIYKLTKSAVKRFNRKISRDGLQIMEGSMIEWYTLPEQLYRAYCLTGEKIYLDFAEEWDYPYFWNKLLSRDFRIGPRHAYSHVNCLSSAMMAYKVKGEEKYLKAVQIGYDEILKHHTFATGGYGPAECLFADEKGYLGDSLKANWDQDKNHSSYRNFGNSICTRDDQWGSCEVSCCSWAVFKLCNYLMTQTGDAKYGDWAEKLLYNGCGGQLPVTNEGKVMYYADYFINGGLKSVEDGRLQPDGSSFEWQCCTGTFPQDVAEYSNMLYYQTKNALYVSQYLASQVEFSIYGAKFCLENKSFYPKDQILKFHLLGDKCIKFTINFRVPSWANGENCVFINEEKVFTEIRPNKWIQLKREWHDGDEIIIHFPFSLRFEPVDSFAKDVVALSFGPLTMVCNKMTLFEGNLKHPENWMEPIQKDGYSFAFRTKPGCVKPYENLTRDFYPYYEVPAMEWYYMYNRVIDTNA